MRPRPWAAASTQELNLYTRTIPHYAIGIPLNAPAGLAAPEPLGTAARLAAAAFGLLPMLPSTCKRMWLILFYIVDHATRLAHVERTLLSRHGTNAKRERERETRSRRVEKLGETQGHMLCKAKHIKQCFAKRNTSTHALHIIPKPIYIWLLYRRIFRLTMFAPNLKFNLSQTIRP